MMIRRRLMAAALVAGVAGCVIIVEPPDPGTVTPTLPPTVHAQMLVQVNIDPSVANMAGAYSRIIRQYQSMLALQTPRVWIDQIAISPLNRTTASGPRLIHVEDLTGALALVDQQILEGQNEQRLEPPIDPDDTSIPSPGIGNATAMQQLLQAAINSQYLQEDPNRGEGQNLAELGRTISTQIQYSLDGSDVGAVPPFASPKDLFIVLTINHLRRPCGLNDAACRLDGQSPLAYFSAKNEHGHAAWLNFGGGQGLPPERIFHLSITTEEGTPGESFYTRCAETPGFPPNLVDTIEPSAARYYGPFASGFPLGGRAVSEDFCTMLGRDGTVRTVLTANAIAGSMQ